MSKTQDDSAADPPKNGAEDSQTSNRTRGSRTIAAGRELLNALRADLGIFSSHLSGALLSRIGSQSRPATATISIGPNSKRAIRRLIEGTALIAAAGILAFTGAMAWALHGLPIAKPIGDTRTFSIVLEAANGQPLGRIGPLKPADVSRQDFPDLLINAIISTEDQRFYSHWGIDPRGIARALDRNVAAGTIVQGGSTITQQLVKIRFLGSDRTLPHKMRELLVAIWLDMHLGKDEILTRYLNSVYMGNNAYGVSSAARLYFDKSPSELTLSEAALLAGMIKCPSSCNPLRNPDLAHVRANAALDAMVENGVINASTAKEAKASPATLRLSGEELRAGSSFADWVAKDAENVTGSLSGNMRVRTTLIPRLQTLAEQIVGEVLAGPGAERGVSQAALVAMRPDGSVVAMVGGRDYRASQFNRAVDALRQPGSAFKLFVYLAALRRGFTLNDMIDASPLDIKGWDPENYGDRQYGRITLAEAFARSVNTAAARLAQQVGLNEVISAARDLGIDRPLPAVPSLALGAVELSLIDLTAAFASVRANQMRVKPWGITGFSLEGQDQLRSMRPPNGSEQSLEPYQKPLIELLQLVVQRGTGRAAALDGFAAGKTGTSQDYRDAWFVGFNEELVVGIWVGNDDSSPMDRVTGGSLPAEIWKRFMIEAMPESQDQPVATSLPDTPVSGTTPRTPPVRCDFQACAGAYESFRASDCTYQPFSGPRTFCARSQHTIAAQASQLSGSSAVQH